MITFVGILIFLYYLAYILGTDLKKNSRLLGMELGMLIYATSCFVYFVAIVFDSFVVMFYAYNIEIAIDNFVHWSFSTPT